MSKSKQISKSVDPKTDIFMSKITKKHDGIQEDGTILSNLGFAGMQIPNKIGIEETICLGGKNSPGEYLNWVKNETGAKMKDWEACSIELYRCWQAPFYERFSALYPSSEYMDDHAFCHGAWRLQPDPKALKVEKLEVFAIRHKAWRFLLTEREKMFYFQRQRSYLIEEWRLRYGKKPINLEIFKNTNPNGFHVRGREKKETNASIISWPTRNFFEALHQALLLKKEGIVDIKICEGRNHIPLKKFSLRILSKIRKSFLEYGEELDLFDVAIESGIIHH